MKLSVTTERPCKIKFANGYFWKLVEEDFVSAKRLKRRAHRKPILKHFHFIIVALARAYECFAHRVLTDIVNYNLTNYDFAHTPSEKQTSGAYDKRQLKKLYCRLFYITRPIVWLNFAHCIYTVVPFVYILGDVVQNAARKPWQVKHTSAAGKGSNQSLKKFEYWLSKHQSFAEVCFPEWRA